MKKLTALLCVSISLFIVFTSAVNAQDLTVNLQHRSQQQKVDVYIGDKYFTSYLYDGALLNKPVLFPVVSASGKTITRGYPLKTREGERVDHTHHHGVWFNHGNVNGIDFWNACRTPPKPGVRYGKIKHRKIKQIKSGRVGELTVITEWFSDSDEKLLQQETRYRFQGSEQRRSITHITTLTSLVKEITFTDSKEGLFGIRVARALELPSAEPVLLTGADLKVKPPAKVNNTGVTGNYRNSEGISGYPAVWGHRARWMQLSGKIEQQSVSILIFDAPSNVNHPPHWMARDYGLFAVNPLGSAIYSEGKETLNLQIKRGETVSFKHQMVVSESSNLSNETIEQWYGAFIEQ